MHKRYYIYNVFIYIICYTFIHSFIIIIIIYKLKDLIFNQTFSRNGPAVREVLWRHRYCIQSHDETRAKANWAACDVLQGKPNSFWLGNHEKRRTAWPLRKVFSDVHHIIISTKMMVIIMMVHRPRIFRSLSKIYISKQKKVKRENERSRRPKIGWETKCK